MLNYFACTLAVDRADGERKYLTGSFSPTLYGITMRSNSDSTSHKDSADRQGNFPNWHVRPRGLLGIPTLFSERFFAFFYPKSFLFFHKKRTKRRQIMSFPELNVGEGVAQLIR